MGEGVGGGVEVVELVFVFFVGVEFVMEVVGGLVFGVLEVVFVVGGGLLDVEDGVGDGLVGDDVVDYIVYFGDVVVGGNVVLEDFIIEFMEGSVGGLEGVENGGGGRVEFVFGDDFVGDFIDEGFEVENVVDVVGFVVGFVGGVVDFVKGVDEFDIFYLFVDGEFDFMSKVVDVVD